jgi:2-amino-4-hydroxy-6-hydroxymethyldihydropteridine diphosphokinase
MAGKAFFRRLLLRIIKFMPQVAFGLGANLGEPLSAMQWAVGEMRSRLARVQVSPVYESAPMYVQDQPRFLNAVVLADAIDSPYALFTWLKSLEERAGRVPGPRNGPRVLDLDLLLYGSARYTFVDRESVVLEVPHPRLAERRFVVQPLFDLAPNLMIPGVGAISTLEVATRAQSDTVSSMGHAIL